MMRWLRRWWNLTKAAQAKLKPDEVPAKTRIAGMMILDGFINRRSICRCCFNYFKPSDHEFADWFLCRSILMIADSEPNPMLCGACFENVIASYNPTANNVGSHNCRPPNLVLKAHSEGLLK